MHPSINYKSDLIRQVNHWLQASKRLYQLDDLASKKSWEGLEKYLQVSLKGALYSAVSDVEKDAYTLLEKCLEVSSYKNIASLHMSLNSLKSKYRKVETLVDFYSDAINSRTNERMNEKLKRSDQIAEESMKKLLTPLGLDTPRVLCYIDKGLGASILKAGLRLWDQKTISPAAAIKIVRHNLIRPTALIHEAGHQVAHILNWNQELKSLITSSLNKSIARTWSSWASEIAADTFGIAHTGYGSVAGLHDVVSGKPNVVFHFNPDDPHPIRFLRLLFGIEACKYFYGNGPWDQMKINWLKRYRIEDAPKNIQPLLRQSIPHLRKIVELCFIHKMKAFGYSSLVKIIDPQKVSPQKLWTFNAGLKKCNSQKRQLLMNNHKIKTLALHSYQIAINQNLTLVRDEPIKFK